ncbi:MAG: AAA family ATPase [Flavobacteriaceae bacterium]
METFPQQQPSSCRRVVLYGPESTGKTTLARALAAHYQTQWVPEFARDYLQEKWDRNQESCGLDDLPEIVKGQIQLENKALSKAHKWLFCDTNVLVTKVWSLTHFHGYCAPELAEAVNHYHYDFYLLTSPDIPWEPDILRDRPHQRDEMFSAFLEELKHLQQPYAIVQGTGEERLQNAILALEKWANVS